MKHPDDDEVDTDRFKSIAADAILRCLDTLKHVAPSMEFCFADTDERNTIYVRIGKDAKYLESPLLVSDVISWTRKGTTGEQIGLFVSRMLEKYESVNWHDKSFLRHLDIAELWQSIMRQKND